MNLKQEILITKDFDIDLTGLIHNIKDILNDWDYTTQITENQIEFLKKIRNANFYKHNSPEGFKFLRHGIMKLYKINSRTIKIKY
jgi:hypothetical protein